MKTKPVHPEFNFVTPPPIESFPARKDDPITSQLAAERKKSPNIRNFGRKTHKGRLLEVFHSAKAKGLLLTDTEAATLVMGEDAAPGPFQGCRRRCTDLRDAGYIVTVEGKEHPNIGTPDDAMVCEITDSGEIAYACMILTGRTMKK